MLYCSWLVKTNKNFFHKKHCSAVRFTKYFTVSQFYLYILYNSTYSTAYSKNVQQWILYQYYTFPFTQWLVLLDKTCWGDITRGCIFLGSTFKWIIKNSFSPPPHPIPPPRKHNVDPGIRVIYLYSPLSLESRNQHWMFVVKCLDSFVQDCTILACRILIDCFIILDEFNKIICWRQNCFNRRRKSCNIFLRMCHYGTSGNQVAYFLYMSRLFIFHVNSPIQLRHCLHYRILLLEFSKRFRSSGCSLRNFILFYFLALEHKIHNFS